MLHFFYNNNVYMDDDTEQQIVHINNSTESITQISCDHRGKYFSTSRGIAIPTVLIHFGRMIPLYLIITLIKTTVITNHLSAYKQNLTTWKGNFSTELSDDEFENTTKQFLTLSEAIDYLPGPKHPAR
ncbi:hypothetical protein C0J52_01610 [Blattella germanica]|nr:hypothetical protein C0J52_01610 [Blattella germanica]